MTGSPPLTCPLGIVSSYIPFPDEKWSKLFCPVLNGKRFEFVLFEEGEMG